jgi:hypothetical protein
MKEKIDLIVAMCFVTFCILLALTFTFFATLFYPCPLKILFFFMFLFAAYFAFRSLQTVIELVREK